MVVIDDIIVCKGSIVNFVIFLVPLKVKMLDIRHLWMESLGCSQWIQCLHSIYIDIDIDIYIDIYIYIYILLNVNFDKSTIGLRFLFISSMLSKFLENQKSITMLLMKCLNFKFF